MRAVELGKGKQQKVDAMWGKSKKEKDDR